MSSAPPPDSSAAAPFPGLYLLPLDSSFFPPKRIALHPEIRVRIGRQLNQKATPSAANGVFESRVLSRQHAEAWIEEGDKIFIKDVKSSNGTFVNGERLSAEGVESLPFELRSDDILEFGIDIVGEHGEVVHRKVACRATCAFNPAEALRAVRTEQRVYPPSSPTNPNPAPAALPPPPPHALVSSPPPPRRPQHATGLAGMGGMGAERIRERNSIVDFDSILARLRDGPSPTEGNDEASTSNAAPPAGAPDAIIAPTPDSDADADTALTALRTGLAQAQAALAALPSSSSSPTNPSPSSSHSHPGPSSVSEVETGAFTSDSRADATPEAVHANTVLLRVELVALRAEVGALQRARARGAVGDKRERTDINKRARTDAWRQGADCDIVHDSDSAHDSDHSDSDSEPTAHDPDGDSDLPAHDPAAAANADEDWADDVDFRAESAAAPSSSAAQLRGVFDEENEGFTLPAADRSADASADAAPALAALETQLGALAAGLATLQTATQGIAGRVAALGASAEAVEGRAAASSSSLPGTAAAGASSSGAEGAGDTHLDVKAELAALRREWAAFRGGWDVPPSYPSSYANPFPQLAPDVAFADPYAPPALDAYGSNAANATAYAYPPSPDPSLRQRQRKARPVYDPACAGEEGEWRDGAGEDGDGDGAGEDGDGAGEDGDGAGEDGDVDAEYEESSGRHQHGRYLSDAGDAGRVPGRWGLPTPVGSVRGGGSASASFPGMGMGIPAGVGAGAAAEGLGTGVGEKGKSQTEPEPHALLLTGAAVGVGALIVGAAWWGA